MRIWKSGFLMFVLVFVLSSSVAKTSTHRALPYPTEKTPQAVDRGSLAAESGTTPLSITIALRLRDLNQAEDLLKALHTPGDPQFHHFLTTDQFVARFAPTDGDVAKVIASLAKYGLAAQRATATTLKVTGLPADMERAFATSLHSYEVPKYDNASSYRFHAPVSRIAIPPELAGAVTAVAGLDTRPNFRPHVRSSSPKVVQRPSLGRASKGGNAPGFWTVTDFANYYDVQPLYSQGISGKGRTLGIITLAAFTPSDAFAYWNALGLSVDPNRITIVNVDGGPGAPSDVSGSVETTLDVEQSGGIAPGAKIIVYQSPNSSQGFLDLFATAVESNQAQTLSTSWGIWEWFQNSENSPVIDPTTGEASGFAEANHELLVRAAIQGQSVFTASGDGGAYDVNSDFGCFGYSPTVPGSCTLTLSVDNPASDPAVTAGGGTTLAGVQQLCLNAACTAIYRVNVPKERVWGWDYLEGLCSFLGFDPVSCGIFPAGSGGGVSVMFRTPSYQNFLPGVQLSQPGQVFQGADFDTLYGRGTYYALPAHYPGRNVPDISFNADPDTGYVIYYTSEPKGVFNILTFFGGTSFTAPQLNGVAALLGQSLHGRIGLLNFPLYQLGVSGQGYRGPHPSFHAIADGDNWFYTGSKGYNPAVGFGTLDVANFARFLAGDF